MPYSVQKFKLGSQLDKCWTTDATRRPTEQLAGDQENRPFANMPKPGGVVRRLLRRNAFTMLQPDHESVSTKIGKVSLDQKDSNAARVLRTLKRRATNDLHGGQGSTPLTTHVGGTRKGGEKCTAFDVYVDHESGAAPQTNETNEYVAEEALTLESISPSLRRRNPTRHHGGQKKPLRSHRLRDRKRRKKSKTSVEQANGSLSDRVSLTSSGQFNLNMKTPKATRRYGWGQVAKKISWGCEDERFDKALERTTHFNPFVQVCSFNSIDPANVLGPTNDYLVRKQTSIKKTKSVALSFAKADDRLLPFLQLSSAEQTEQEHDAQLGQPDDTHTNDQQVAEQVFEANVDKIDGSLIPGSEQHCQTEEEVDSEMLFISGDSENLVGTQVTYPSNMESNNVEENHRDGQLVKKEEDKTSSPNLVGAVSKKEQRQVEGIHSGELSSSINDHERDEDKPSSHEEDVNRGHNDAFRSPEQLEKEIVEDVQLENSSLPGTPDTLILVEAFGDLSGECIPRDKTKTASDSFVVSSPQVDEESNLWQPPPKAAKEGDDSELGKSSQRNKVYTCGQRPTSLTYFPRCSLQQLGLQSEKKTGRIHQKKRCLISGYTFPRCSLQSLEVTFKV